MSEWAGRDEEGRIRLAVQRANGEQTGAILDVAEKWVKRAKFWIWTIIGFVIAIAAVLTWFSSFARKKELETVAGKASQAAEISEKLRINQDDTQREMINMHDEIHEMRQAIDRVYNLLIEGRASHRREGQ